MSRPTPGAGSVDRDGAAPVTHRAIAVIEHQPSCPAGWVGDWLAAAGARLQVFRPYAAAPGSAGPALPTDPTAYAGIVVLGGSMGAGDDTACPWLPGVRALIRDAATAQVPTLGICLGHQLAAVALGGRIAPNPRGRSIGLLPVQWTADAITDALTGPLAATEGQQPGPVGVHWNDDIVTDVPADAVVLARAATGEVQAARFAPSVWGVQWHPEVGPGIAADWMHEDDGAHQLRGVDVGAHVAAIAAAEPALRHSWGALARRFGQLCRAS